MSDNIGCLGVIFVDKVDPFPVDTTRDQIGVELRKEDIQKLIDYLNSVLTQEKERDGELISARIRFEGAFVLEHFGTEPLVDIEERMRQLRGLTHRHL